MQELSMKEQFDLPLVKDLIEENEELKQTATLAGTVLPDSKIKTMTVPHTFKNKLVMQVGKFNGVNYEKQDLLDALAESDNADLMYDHLDTKEKKGALAFVGKLRKPLWGTNEQGEGILADLTIADLSCAQKLALGAKWGVSPTIDYDGVENENGEITAKDLNWKSFSFVTDPAVRATMLNSKQKKGGAHMAHEPDKDKKVPYKFPKDGTLAKKKDKDDDIEMSQIEVPENVLPMLEKKDEIIAELQEFKDKIVDEQKSDLASDLANNEFLIGRVELNELEDRRVTLTEKSPEILKELSEVIGEHAELQSFKQFVNDFLKKNPGKTIKDAAAAWNKKKPKTAENTGDEAAEPAAEPDIAELEAQPLTAQPAQGQETAELSKQQLRDADTEFAKTIAKCMGHPEVVQ